MKVFLPLLLCLFFCTCVRAQEVPPSYRLLADEAQASYQQDLPRKAVKLYAEAFTIDQSNYLDVLRAAIAARDAEQLAISGDLLTHGFIIAPVDMIITFLEGQEFSELRSGPFNKTMMARAAYALGPSENGFIGKASWASVSRNYVSKSDHYVVPTEIAYRSMQRGDYQRGLTYYQQAFEVNNLSFLSKMRAATCAYMVKEEATCQNYLDEVFRKRPVLALSVLRTKPEFQAPLSKPRFAEMVGVYITTNFPELNAKLVNEIDELWEFFLVGRRYVPDTLSPLAYGQYFSEITDPELLLKKDLLLDSFHQRLDHFIEMNQIPSHNKIGDRKELLESMVMKAPLSFFETRRALLFEAGKSDHLFGTLLALAYDYALYLNGQKQSFGSITYVSKTLKDSGISMWPIEDPQGLKQRRKEMGMQPIKDVLGYTGHKFKIREHLNFGPMPANLVDEIIETPYRLNGLTTYPQ
jgi:tetratricopeptide (TPR) repeat protein